jgi:hypothetical protein
VKLFLNDVKPGKASMKLSGATDNAGNSFVVSKLLSTKFPLGPVLMELSEELATKQAWLSLEWTPRELNTEADDLTNERFHKFDLSRRINVSWEQLEFIALPSLLEKGALLFEEVQTMRRSKKPQESRRKKFKKESTLEPW